MIFNAPFTVAGECGKRQNGLGARRNPHIRRD